MYRPLLTLLTISTSLFCYASYANAAEPEVVNTEPANLQPATPKEALAKVKVPDGFKVTLFAGEPDVRQPIAMAVDHKGRLWVAECYSYPKWTEPGTGLFEG